MLSHYHIDKKHFYNSIEDLGFVNTFALYIFLADLNKLVLIPMKCTEKCLQILLFLIVAHAQYKAIKQSNKNINGTLEGEF